MILNNILAEVTQDPDLQITDPEQNELFEQLADRLNRLEEPFYDDRRYPDILVRIRNYIRKLSANRNIAVRINFRITFESFLLSSQNR